MDSSSRIKYGAGSLSPFGKFMVHPDGFSMNGRLFFKVGDG